ncbi:MAG: sulfatase-like hydrolase/transferase [Verrucomicrobia bacterium]|nr:sulfatase-like hydrolase/transferase [Verrucomicrobiota bacterium]
MKQLQAPLFAAALTLVPLWSLGADSVKPNILWLTCEDIGPQLGCYGDKYAVTPNLDKLAAKGVRYRACWSNAPVCAPARTTIITGVFPTSTGGHHMRSMVPMPPGTKMYPQLLREAGYYCTNNSKEDYNLEKAPGVWDESSGKAHYKNRASGQPFFAIFNNTVTHESQIRKRPHTAVHNPAKVRVPAYHPDTPEVRQDWAQYYDNITTMDATAGERLRELAEAGLADDTIVFFYGDHGSGMPRSKRFPYNSGLQVPLIVFIPEKYRALAPKDYQPGAMLDRPVSFVDLAPTLASLVGIQPPDWMQGYAFLGKHDAGPQRYVHGFRGRMDERYDLIRSVRNDRYVYLRNFMPHVIYGQHIAYMFETPTTTVWKQLFDAGKLKPPQTFFWERKPPEELYDLQNDPDETKNLVNSPDHQQVLAELRKAQHDHALRIRDVALLPEAEMLRRSKGRTPYELGHDPKFPLEKILATAELASSLKADALPQLREALADTEPGVRWWAATGLLMRGVAPAELHKVLSDESPSVRIAAARALGQCGNDEDLKLVLPLLLSLAGEGVENFAVRLEALNAIDALGRKASPLAAELRKLAESKPAQAGKGKGRKAKGGDGEGGGRTGSYAPRLLKEMVSNLP